MGDPGPDGACSTVHVLPSFIDASIGWAYALMAHDPMPEAEGPQTRHGPVFGHKRVAECHTAPPSAVSMTRAEERLAIAAKMAATPEGVTSNCPKVPALAPIGAVTMCHV